MSFRVERQPDGRHAILDGSLIVGAFDTNEAAWRALDRLCGENVSPVAARASWGFARAATVAPYARTSPSSSPSLGTRPGKRRHLSESQRSMVAAKLAKLPPHMSTEDDSANLRTSDAAEAGALLNVSERSEEMANSKAESLPVSTHRPKKGANLHPSAARLPGWRKKPRRRSKGGK